MRQPTPQSLKTAGSVFIVVLFAFSVAAASSAGQADKEPKPSATGPHLDHPDTVCRSCHREIYDLYQQTPMAQGSGLAIDGLDQTELAAKDLVHAASGVSYHLSVEDHQPYLRYSRPATPQRPALNGQFRLDYFIGSGRRGRTYLYNIDNLWFETPINWYGKSQMWDMAPAFDNTPAMPGPLPVDSNCLHCHATDVQAALGSVRNRYAVQPFRTAGIGCSACHGDPAEHLRQTSIDHNTNNKAKIVNPDKLDAARRDSVCLQCHLEGDAAVYLPGKSLQAFKPGEDLSKAVTYFIDSTRTQLGLRASSQYEALLRSACKRATGDALTCTTCHDPHSSPSPATRVAYFRARCLSCHTGEAIATLHHPEQQDCAVCHMPTRKTSDISHEQLTDHDIESRPSSLQNAPQNAHRLAAVLVPVGGGVASDRETGLVYAQLAERGDRSAGERALQLLIRASKDGKQDSEVLDQLGFLFQASGSPNEAADQYLAAMRMNPSDIVAQSNLAVIEASQGKLEEAIRLLSKSVADDPGKTASGLNLAFLQCQGGHKTEALKTIQQVLRYNPDSDQARRLRDTGSYGGQRCAMQ